MEDDKSLVVTETGEAEAELGLVEERIWLTRLRRWEAIDAFFTRAEMKKKKKKKKKQYIRDS